MYTSSGKVQVNKALCKLVYESRHCVLYGVGVGIVVVNLSL